MTKTIRKRTVMMMGILQINQNTITIKLCLCEDRSIDRLIHPTQKEVGLREELLYRKPPEEPHRLRMLMAEVEEITLFQLKSNFNLRQKNPKINRIMIQPL
jgi:hypothetical protein